MNRIFVYSGLIALVVSAATISVFNHFKSAEGQKIQIEHVSATPSATAVYTLGEDGEVVPLDFTRIAQSVTDAVVHIKAAQAPQRSISLSLIHILRSPETYHTLASKVDEI